MQKDYVLHLSGLDLGQLIDGLCVREKAWRNTATFFRDGSVPDETFVCEECKDEHEAKYIADHYKRIITELQKQRKEQDSKKSNIERELYLDAVASHRMQVEGC